jgi:hypothetical protein
MFALIANALAAVLASLFAIAAAVHLIAPAALRAAYRRWQFGSGFHYAVGIAQLLAAVFLAVPQTRIWGGILAAVILFATITSLLNRRKYCYALPAIMAMLAIAPALAAR